MVNISVQYIVFSIVEVQIGYKIQQVCTSYPCILFFKILLSKKSAISAVIIYILLIFNKINTALLIEKVP